MADIASIKNPNLMDGIKNSVDANIADIINHTNSVVCDDIYKLNKEFFGGYQWIACLDSTTCLACAELDNKIFDRLAGMEGEGTAPPDDPPLHHRCRCVIVPVLEGMRDDPSQTQINYKDWFDRQDDETKLDILGPSRYKEYLNGKPVTFFAKDGRIKSLEELEIDRMTRKKLFAELSGSSDEKEIEILDETEKIKETVEKKKLALTGKEINLEKLTLKDMEELVKNDNYEYKTKWDVYKNMTSEEVIAELKNRYGFDFKNGENLNIDIAREIAFNLERINERFPGLVEKTSLLEFKPSKSETNKEFAYFSPSDNSIHLKIHSKHWNDIDTLLKLYNDQVKVKHWPCGGNEITPVLHEWGHLWHTLVNRAINNNSALSDAMGFSVAEWDFDRTYTAKNWGNGIETLLVSKIQDYYKSIGGDWQKLFILNNLSDYANTNTEEFLSEAFAEYMTSNNPRPIAKIIGGIMEQIWRDYRQYL